MIVLQNLVTIIIPTFMFGSLGPVHLIHQQNFVIQITKFKIHGSHVKATYIQNPRKFEYVTFAEFYKFVMCFKGYEEDYVPSRA
jgi:hypothetical protein